MVIGRIEADSYEMKTNYGFLQYTDIRDVQGRILGDIDYSTWTGKATVTLGSRKYYWKASNFFGTSWALADTDGREVYRGKEFLPDQVHSGEDILLLFLISSFLHGSYQR